MEKQLPKLIPLTEVARCLGVSPHVVQCLPLRSFRLGARHYLVADEVAAFFAAPMERR